MLRTELIRPLPEMLVEHAERRGGMPAFADADRRVTYAELAARTRRLAGHLAGLRVQPGDRVAIYLGNRVETVESYLAITRASAIGVPLNPHSSDAELAYFLDDSGARVVITDSAHAGQVTRIRGDGRYPALVVTGPDHPPAGAASFDAMATNEPEIAARDDLDLNDVAWMLYTSGTTGRPKGVLSTQRSCLWSVAACYAPVPDLAPDDRVLWPLPLFHSLSHIACVLAVTAVGASARITDGYSADEVLAAMRAGSPTLLAGVPTTYHYLVQAARQHGFTAPDLRIGLVGGAVTTAALRASVEETFDVPLLDAYGSTETCGSIAINWPSGARVEGSCGLPVPGLNVRLVDPDTERDVPAGVDGEVWVSGPSVMVGYHNRPEETAAALRGGWYRTGDLASRDDTGYLTIRGRIKDLIIRGGENIHPGEVEDVVRTVPGVADVAVAGKPHDVLGEVVVAFLVPEPGGVNTEAVFAACRERLAPFKVPDELYEVAGIPRTRSGKVTRHVLLGAPARLRAVGTGYYDSLLRLDWVPLPLRHGEAGDTGGDATVTVLRVPPAADLDGTLEEVADGVRSWLAERRSGRLVVVTRGGVRAQPGDLPDPAEAAVAGLVRGFQARHGDRVVLVDLAPGNQSDVDAEIRAAVLGDGGTQFAVRSGAVLRPVLERVAAGDRDAVRPDSGRTAVIAGADTPAGAAIARHLVAGYGVRRLLLIGERGQDDPAVVELAEQLPALSPGRRAVVRVAACDVADRAALADTLAPAGTAPAIVVYAATGAPASAAVGAANLDALTSDVELAAFVLVSDAGATLGMPGEPNTAAVAGLFDALALHGQAAGRPMVSLSLGPWADDASPVPAGPVPVGIGTLSVRDLLATVDAALLAGEAAMVPVRLDPALRHEGVVPAVLRGLFDTSPGRAAPVAPSAHRTAELRAELAGQPEPDRLRTLVDTVCDAAAGVRAEAGGDPDRPFREVGFSSLQVVELRNRLVELTGLALPVTLTFDHPTPRAVARFVLGAVLGVPAGVDTVVAHGMAGTEPIAIVGMACRLPGGIASPEDLWNFVVAERDGITPFPADRGWDVDAIYDPDPEHHGTTYVRDGGFLTDAAGFDADFFGVSPREALAMDPQQRLFLEVSWEAFERAGVDVTSLRGSRTGVFAGVMNQEYGTLVDVEDDTEGYRSTGGSGSVVSGRVAYSFGFEGPAVTVDTACSSSLVALHLAGQSLRSGESDLALAGGVAVMARPSSFVEFSRQRGLAPDGRCKAFAATADGTGWSEGVAVLVLERLSDARRNGHGVLAVVAGSAVNSDGASNGLTAPNGLSQQRVIRQALANAGVGPSDVDLVEAHGTGTALGDPIEAQALLATYGQERDRPLWLGSLKSNIGHTQAAAGAAGVIKAVLAMRHGVLPKTLHVDAPTPHVDWADGGVELLTEATQWPEVARPRRAGVSAFGVSGTNAHVIIEQAPEPAPAPERAEEAAAVPWVLSAKTPAALAESAARLAGHVEQHADHTAVATAARLAARPRHEHRAVVVGSDRDELLRGLRAVASGAPDPVALTGIAGVEGRTVFVFPGQGTQWAGMGAGLLESSPVFADVVAKCDEALSSFVDWSVTDVVRRGVPSLDRVDVVQPVSFVMMVGLARLWQHHGVRPDAVIGHSQGEIAAAHVAGALSLDDAVRVVALRSQAIARQLAGRGAMISVALPGTAVEEKIASFAGRLEIATVNGPASVVVAGDPAAVDELGARLEAEGVRARKIAVDYASHTSQVERIENELLELLEPVRPKAPEIPMWSTTDSAWVDGPVLTGEYWYRNLRHTVRFHDGVDALAEQDHRIFIEVSTHPVLTAAIAEGQGDHPSLLVVPTLRRDQDEPATFHTALAHVHAHTNLDIDWHLPPVPPALDDPLPTYPFQHHRFWLETGKTGDLGAVGLDDTGHPLLGAAVHLPNSGGVVFTNRISTRTQPWLAEHAVSGAVLVPGAALLELAVRAGDEVGAGVVSELVLEAPLTLPERGGVRLRVTVGDLDGTGSRPVTVHSSTDGGDAVWTRHASGSLTGTPVPPPARHDWPPAGAQQVAIDDFYPGQRDVGMELGPLFRGLRTVWTRGDEVFAEVGLPDGTRHVEAFLLHPALLDAALHAAAYLPGRGGPSAPARLPFAWTGGSIHAGGATALRVRLRATGTDAVAVELTDTTGGPVASIEAFTTRAIDQAALFAGTGTAGLLYRVDWVPVAVRDRSPVPEELLDLTTTTGGPPSARARDLVLRALDAIRRHLTEAEPDRPLVVLTRDARHDPAMAAVWGLGRTAQSEHPGRVVLIDADTDADVRELLPAALATGEPQLALRGTTVTAPRLAGHEPAGTPKPLDTGGTVLITGGTGTLGGLVARRLVTQHGIRHLLLASRQGHDAPDAGRLRDELTALGATVTIMPCDLSDRAAVAMLVESVPAECPLTAVIHSAAALDDGVLTALDAGRVERVFAPKVDGAWYLHELTQHLDLAAFVLFSSASGTLGNAGQGNYAAANGFLDGLAGYRRARGLPASSLAWGLWAPASGLTSALLDDSRGHLKQDVAALTGEEGMRLLDAVLARPDDPAVLVPVKLSLPALRQSPNPPAVVRDLLPATRPAAGHVAGPTESFVDELRRLAPPERLTRLLDTVRAHAAATLGHTDSASIDDRQPFRELGFDSLAAVDLRNRVGAATGLRLPATLVFDHPDPATLATHLHDELGLTEETESVAVRALAEVDRLEAALADLLRDNENGVAVAERLRKLADRWRGPDIAPELDAVTDDEILRLAEAELDRS